MTARRRWLAHCSATLLLAPALAALPAFAAAARATREQKILVVGDSLSAEYGLQRGSGWVALLAARLAREHPEASVVNASISGDTTSGGVSRIEPLLASDVGVLVLELGANDGLRGVAIPTIETNLSTMIEAAQRRNIRVLLCGMETLPTHGWDYALAFHNVFPRVASRYAVPLVPFLLAGVVLTPDMSRDGIHPNAAGAHRIADTIWPHVEPLLHK